MQMNQDDLCCAWACAAVLTHSHDVVDLQVADAFKKLVSNK